MTKKTKPGLRTGHWLAGEYGWQIRYHPHAWRPPTDVFETDRNIVVVVEIAGMRSKDFVINFESKVLSIQGSRNPEEGSKIYHQMEISNGHFVTEVSVTSSIDADRIEAVYKDGFLRVVLPKLESQHIKIDS